MSPLDGLYCGASQTTIVIDLEHYLEWVDFTGRCVKEGKSGSVPGSLLPLLERLALDNAHWVDTVKVMVVCIIEWRVKQSNCRKQPCRPDENGSKAVLVAAWSTQVMASDFLIHPDD